MKEIKCIHCNKSFTTKEALEMHTKAKHPQTIEKPKFSTTSKKKKKIRNWIIFILIVLIIIYGTYYFSSNTKTLPPTDIANHIEASPPSHVLKEPMPLAIQKHMLEHADGSGPPGVVINYNCIDFECEEDLISNLEKFAEKYPANVYVAPFPKMDAKIALTRLNRIQVLETYNEEEIDNFIR